MSRFEINEEHIVTVTEWNDDHTVIVGGWDFASDDCEKAKEDAEQFVKQKEAQQ